MKKLLGIVIMSLLFCSDGFAGKTVNLPKDVASGLPKDFINVHPTKVALGQFHQEKGHVVWMYAYKIFG
jgi:hypothetical protein